MSGDCRSGGVEARAVVVTGAASGIGAATARLLAEGGRRPWCVDRDVPGAERVAATIRDTGGDAVAFPIDVTDEDAWERLAAALAAGPAPVALVHCAGISVASALAETPLDEWRRVLSVNLDGAFLAVRFGIRAMAGQGGAIVLVGSASGIRPPPGAAAYATSKAAVAALARAAAKECRAAGIPVRINVVSPAGVRTPMWRSMPFFEEIARRLGSEEAAFAEMASAGGGTPFAEPEAVARVIRFLVSDEAAHVTGAELPADDGWSL